jgi:hypothetical protein
MNAEELHQIVADALMPYMPYIEKNVLNQHLVAGEYATAVVRALIAHVPNLAALGSPETP